MSIAESLDGQITRVLQADKNRVIAEVTVPLKDDDEHIQYFLKQWQKGRVITDLISRLAQIGINQRVISQEENPFHHHQEGGRHFFTYTSELYKFIPEWFIKENGEEIGLDGLIGNEGPGKPGTFVSKLYVENPNLLVEAQEIERLKKSGDIHLPAIRKDSRWAQFAHHALTKLKPILPREEFERLEAYFYRETKLFEDGTLEAPIIPEIFHPRTELLTRENLAAIIDRRTERSDLWIYKVMEKLSGARLVVKANSGTVTHTSLFTGLKEVVIQDKDHSDARMCSYTTNGMIALEFLSRGEEYTVDSVRMKFYHQPKLKTVKKQEDSIVQGPRSLESKIEAGLRRVDAMSPSGDGHLAFAWRYGPASSIVVVKDFMEGPDELKIPEGVRDGYYQLGLSLRRSEGKSSLVMSHFPDERLAAFLVTNSHQIDRIVFRHAHFFSEYFAEQGYSDLLKLGRNGVNVYWAPDFLEPKKLMKLHGDFFIEDNKEKIELYDRLLRSRRLVAFYGSSGEANEKNKKDIEQSIEGLIEIFGKNFGVLTGGFGRNAKSIMSRMANAAMEREILYVACPWEIPYEKPPKKADAYQAFGRHAVSPRQEIMDRTTEIQIFHEGGFGTDYEAALSLDKKNLEIGPNKPMIFVGDYFKPLKQWYEHIVRSSRGREQVLNSVYFVRNGSEVKDVIYKHYHLMKKPIQMQGADPLRVQSALRN